jgi:uncharacterized protein with NRDE domain
MCTVVILHRPDHDWPLIAAANRDEMIDRHCKPPGRHWPERSNVVAGLDELAGGTWLGMNDSGVVAGILNRVNTLGPLPGLESRGEIPLRALTASDAYLAAKIVTGLNPDAYRPFNMFIADNRNAFWIRCRQADNMAKGSNVIDVAKVPRGLSMITAYDRNDLNSPRIRRYLQQFQNASEPDPKSGDWSEWISILGCTEHDPNAGPGGAMCVVTDHGFGTVSSSLIALPKETLTKVSPVWLFSSGPPGQTDYTEVNL